MASKNKVEALGMVAGTPVITSADGIRQADFFLYTLRQDKKTPAGEDGTDMIAISTRDVALIGEIKKFRKYDVVHLIGVFCSADVEKYFKCENPDCKMYGIPIPYKGTQSYVSPTEFLRLNRNQISEYEAKLLLHQHRGHAGSAVVLGAACGDTVHVPVKKSNDEVVNIWRTRIRIKMPKLRAGTLRSQEFVTVNSYKPVEAGDGDFVYADGFLKSKEYKKIRKCPDCGREIVNTDYSLCVVPYEVEYITRNKGGETT